MLWAALTVAALYLGREATLLSTNALVKLVVVLVGLVVAVGAFERPQWALFAIPAIAAFDRPVPVLGAQISLTVLALTLFAPVFALQWRSSAVRPAVRVGAAALVAGGLLSCLSALDTPTAITGAITWALILNLILGGLGLIARRPGVLMVLAVEVAAVGSVVAVLGWLQGMGHYTVVGPPFVADRVDSSFGWYTNYANFVALTGVIAIGAAVAFMGRRRRGLAMLTAGCAGINVYGTLVSLSRGALLCLGVGIAVFVITQFRRPAVLIASGVTIAGASLIAILLIPPTLISEIILRFQVAPGGDSLRGALQSAGWRILANHPQGIGFGGFRTTAQSGALDVGDTILAHCHELFVEIGLDYGWLGLAGFAILILYGVTSGTLQAVTERQISFRAPFVAALVGVALQGLNDYFFFEPASTVAFGIVLLGALGGATHPVTDGNADPLPTNRLARLTSALSAAARVRSSARVATDASSPGPLRHRVVDIRKRQLGFSHRL